MKRPAPLLLLLPLLAACPRSIGPSSEIAARLATVRAGTVLHFEGLGKLTLAKAQFDRVLVKPEGGGFTAIATVDIEGSFLLDAFPGLPPIAVSALGLERVPFVLREGRWTLAPTPLPALGGAAALMARRLGCLRSGCPASDWEPLLSSGYQDPRVGRAALVGALAERDPEPLFWPSRWLVRTDRTTTELFEESPLPRRWTLSLEQGRMTLASGLP